jgi:DNA uptake protein ComE-like DNA-binding protein
VSVNKDDRRGNSALMKLIHREVEKDPIEKVKCYKFLLSHPNIDVNAQNDEAATALTEAAIFEEYTIFMMLMKHKNIQLNTKSYADETALERVTCYVKPVYIRQLLKKVTLNTKEASDLILSVGGVGRRDAQALMCIRQILNFRTFDCSVIQNGVLLVMRDNLEYGSYRSTLLSHGCV